jgi:hypothetical protein
MGNGNLGNIAKAGIGLNDINTYLGYMENNPYGLLYSDGIINWEWMIKHCSLQSYAVGIELNVMYDKTVNEYDWNNDGTNLSISQIYPDLVVADTSNIIYDAGGNPKILDWNSVANITNNQLFINKITEQIMFYEEELSGDCLNKANKFMGFNVPLAVVEGSLLTSDGELWTRG